MTLVISDRADFKEKLEFLIGATNFIFASGAIDDELLTDQLLDSFMDQFDTTQNHDHSAPVDEPNPILDPEEDEVPGYYDGKPYVFVGFTIVNTATGNIPPYFVDKVYKKTEKANEALVAWGRERDFPINSRFAIKKVYVDTEHY